MNSATIVQKLWNYCNVLRDDGMSYGDYVEQLTYLLFLKRTCRGKEARLRGEECFKIGSQSHSSGILDWRATVCSR